jgi:hypothetical protein
LSKGRNTSKYAVEQALLDNDLELPPSRLKRAGMAKLTPNGIPIPQMDEEDAECAARYPYLSDHSKEEVLDMAEMAGIDTRGMAKIDACHALHNNGIINELGLVKVNGLGKVVGAVNNDWVCNMPTNVVTNISCGQKSKGAVGMGAWADKVYGSQAGCNLSCVDRKGGLVNNAKQQLADLLNKKHAMQAMPMLPPVNPLSQVGPLRQDGTFGKKCKRSIVNHHVKMRDNKGRFCKSKKAKKIRSKSRSSSRKHRRSMRK